MNRPKLITAIEIVISLLAILLIVGIAVFLLNPSRKSSETRNAQRLNDITKVFNGVVSYIEKGGKVVGITISKECEGEENEICRFGAADCTNKISLDSLVEKGSISLPVDPSSTSLNGTGYNIVQNERGRITVCAPLAELGENISLSQ